jgi:hypothetical protein
MQFGAGACGSVSLGSVMQDPGAIVDPTSLRPILTELNGVDARQLIRVGSLRIQDTLGQPVTASFAIVNPTAPPVVGDKVRIFYHSQLIFAGTMDRVQKVSPDLQTFEYQVDCLDWTQTLMRRKVQRNFTYAPIQNVLDSLLDNELIDEALTIGTIESRATLPLVDSRSGKALDVCRDMAAATGQTFYLSFERSIEMRSTLVPVAPLVLNETTVLLDGTQVTTDRETYRNVQRVLVTGTPRVKNQDPLETVQERRNADQIAARQAIEGGSGIYEEVEDITHPTSNDGVEIALLGISYARLRLATNGTPRTTARCRARGYGFRAGQMATVELPTFGLSGTFAVQRVTIREELGTLLFHDLELTNSSLQQRAYESWLKIVGGGTVTVQVPGSIMNNLEAFNTPGATTWTVPAGVETVELTCIGGSGAGGGGHLTYIPIDIGPPPHCELDAYKSGGTGGASGRAVTILDVVSGQVLDVVVGAAGIGGVNGVNGTFCAASVTGVAGADGGHSQVLLSSVVRCQGSRGAGGARGLDGGSNGAVGSGIGDAVSVGGGVVGGQAGVDPGVEPTGGQDGRVEIRW